MTQTTFDKEVYKEYIDYILEQAKNLLAIDSPSGFGAEVTSYLMEELKTMGVCAKMSTKGGVLANIPSKREDEAILFQAHCDTLGAMIHEIKGDGRLKLTNIGGMEANNAEAENVRIRTREGKVYEGTCQLINASVHVNPDYRKTERTWKNMEVVIDEDVSSKKEVEALGIMVGDYVCFDPRTKITESGYIKSRFLDDKLSAAILLGYAKYLKDRNITPDRSIYLHFTIYEEVGHGGSSPCPEEVNEVWSVDMGCVGEGLNCTEREVSIAAKDSGGPYNYEVVSRLIELAKKYDIGYAVDIYPFYGSDVEATLSAGFDVKHALIGPGVYASHGYERSHRDGVANTFRLIQAYMEDR
ncbi:M42 family metallopeptidase [Filifactor villosus]|uniref:M42 family metallopeptidase n=1 Tax=Filifactor villosus TaxID=29374 RepID=A0ABV9QM31_9FIRM